MNTFWDLYISWFSFFLYDCPFLVHSSIILPLILKIKRNYFLDVPAASQIARERTIFLNPVSRTYSERSKVTSLSPCFVFIFCLSQRGEKGQPHQFLVRTTFSSFSRPNHIEILFLSILFFLSVRSLKINAFFKNMATLGHKTWLE